MHVDISCATEFKQRKRKWKNVGSCVLVTILFVSVHLSFPFCMKCFISSLHSSLEKWVFLFMCVLPFSLSNHFNSYSFNSSTSSLLSWSRDRHPWPHHPHIGTAKNGNIPLSYRVSLYISFASLMEVRENWVTVSELNTFKGWAWKEAFETKITFFKTCILFLSIHFNVLFSRSSHSSYNFTFSLFLFLSSHLPNSQLDIPGFLLIIGTEECSKRLRVTQNESWWGEEEERGKQTTFSHLKNLIDDDDYVAKLCFLLQKRGSLFSTAFRPLSLNC